MNTCDTCRYWEKKAALIHRKPKSEDDGERRVCTHGWFDIANYDRSNYDTECPGDYSTGFLATDAKFGCIHHEPK